MGHDLGELNVIYHLDENKFDIVTNFVNPIGVVWDYIRSQAGKGEDKRPVNNADKYNIQLTLDVEGDIFTCTHDCGNDALATGILLHLADAINNNQIAKELCNGQD